MARQLLSFETTGFRDSMGRFAARSKLAESRVRDAMRTVGRMATEALRQRAPKKTGTFARGLHYRTYVRDNRTLMRTYAAGEHGYLLKWIRDGTKPHKIPVGGSAEMMAKGYPLRFFWEKGPRGPGIYRFWSVNHPGTKPNPFITEAADAIEDDVYDELRKVAASVVRL